MSLFMILLHGAAHAASRAAAKSERSSPLTWGRAIGCLTAAALALCLGISLFWWITDGALNRKAPPPQGNAREQAAINAVCSAGGSVALDDKDPDKPVTGVNLDGTARRLLDPGLLKQFGKLKRLKVCLTPATDGRWDALARLETLESLDLSGTSLPQGLPQRLAALHELRYLNLDHCGITDDGLKSLEAFPNLEVVALHAANVTDAGLEHLEVLKGLSFLNLCNTQITDGGLDRLAQFPNLTDLLVWNTKVTREGLERLIKASPKLRVSNEQLIDKEAWQNMQQPPRPVETKNPLDWLFR
jgi:Leucine Rich repeat